MHCCTHAAIKSKNIIRTSHLVNTRVIEHLQILLINAYGLGTDQYFVILLAVRMRPKL